MNKVKKAGVCAGIVAGAVIGGTVSMIGKMAEKKVIDELGESIMDSTILTGEIVGEAASGTTRIISGSIQKRPEKVRKGKKELGNAGKRVVGNVVSNVKIAARQGEEILAGVRAKDKTRVAKGFRTLGKMALVGMLTVGAIKVDEMAEEDPICQYKKGEMREKADVREASGWKKPGASEPDEKSQDRKKAWEPEDESQARAAGREQAKNRETAPKIGVRLYSAEPVGGAGENGQESEEGIRVSESISEAADTPRIGGSGQDLGAEAGNLKKQAALNKEQKTPESAAEPWESQKTPKSAADPAEAVKTPGNGAEAWKEPGSKGEGGSKRRIKTRTLEEELDDQIRF